MTLFHNIKVDKGDFFDIRLQEKGCAHAGWVTGYKRLILDNDELHTS